MARSGRCGRRRGGLAALAVLLLVLPSAAKAGAPPDRAEIPRILAHGPWPAEPPGDPSNPLARNAAARELGRSLFSDRRLARNAALSCASCHKPERAWTDGRMRASSAMGLDRNTPSLVDVAHYRRFGWDGALATLWQASLRPILDRRELAADAEGVKALLVEDAQYASAVRKLTGAKPQDQGADTLTEFAAKALAAYQTSLASGPAPFDRLRDRLAGGSPLALAAEDYPPAALAGLRLFVGEAACSTCHAGPAFSDGALHTIGPSAVAYRTPQLRGVAATGPYFHDGSRETLAAAVRHGPAAGSLTEDEVASLAAFLATLTPLMPVRP